MNDKHTDKTALEHFKRYLNTCRSTDIPVRIALPSARQRYNARRSALEAVEEAKRVIKARLKID